MADLKEQWYLKEFKSSDGYTARKLHNRLYIPFAYISHMLSVALDSPTSCLNIKDTRIKTPVTEITQQKAY